MTQIIKHSMLKQSIKQFLKDTVNEKTSLRSKVIYFLMSFGMIIGYSEIGHDKDWWQAAKLHQITHGFINSFLS